MNYEKKYRDLVKAIKKFQEVNPFIQKWVKDNVPELKESEDERIRKSLIDMLKNDEKCYLKEIAWLEKQDTQDDDSNILQRFSFYSYKDEPDVLYLAGVFVNEDCRNKGIGTKILKVADEIASSMRCQVVRLKTQKDTDAYKLYIKNGYSVLIDEGNQVWLEKKSSTTSSIKWHDVSEKPEKNREILCEWRSSDNCIWHDTVFYNPANEAFWNYGRQVDHVTRWCYVDDIVKRCEQKETLCDKCREEQPPNSCQDITSLGRCVLENKGKQKPQSKSAHEAWKDMRFEVYAQASGNRHEPNCSDDKTKMFSLSDIDEIIEKISEQKPIDKAEPKFHKGEWISCKELNTARIIGIVDDRYEVEFIDGSKGLPHIDYIDRNFHLYTIQDAKDGDVLYAKGSYFKEYLFMFSSFTEDNVISTHFGYDVFHGAFDKNLIRFAREKELGSVTPATKEQRDTLMKAMADTGYTFDFEKKELKKIEQPPTGKVKPKFEIGDVMRTLKEASNDIKNGLPVVVSIDDEYYHCSNELIAIKDQDNYEYPPMNKKPADKVEPKFKVGHWIVSSVLGIARIIGVNDSNEYQLEYIDGKQKFSSIDYVNYAYDKWTIQDAKEGDILSSEDGVIILVKDSRNSSYGYRLSYHCAVLCNGTLEHREFHVEPEKFFPATKEQCELLFQKMKEAGYKWDAEQKQLKKIEQDCHCNGVREPKEATGVLKQLIEEQKPIWSREDEQNLNAALSYINDEYLRRWLKDVITVKYDNPAWSEKDESGLSDAIWAVEHAVIFVKDENDMGNLRHADKWLKSLKDRYTYKPSEEQLDALETAISSLQSTTLESLYNELKKL